MSFDREFEALLRRRAFELGLAVDELRKMVDAHVVDSDHGDRLRSLLTIRDKIGPDGSGPHMVCEQWVTARPEFRCSLVSVNVYSGDTLNGVTYSGPRWEVRRNVYDGEPVFAGRPGVVLLWALALELDERGATFTGEQVCRECSGRGARIVALDQSVIGGLRHVPARARGTEFDVTCARNRWTADIVVCPKPVHAHDGARTTRLVMMPCPFCAIGRHTRPVTVSLEWLVRKLAAADPFRAELTGWPDAWQAQLDRWQASGETHWRAQWWLAFAEWAVGGKVPDEHQLARLLAMRIPELRERLLFDRQRRALRPKDRNVRIGNLSARSVITPVQGQPEVEAVADAVFGQLADGLPDFVPRTRREWTLYESSPRLQNERQHVFVWATAERTPFGFIEFTAQAFVSREADGRIVVIGSTRGDLETRS